MNTSNATLGRLGGKVALITGAARKRGMGYAIGKLFANEGASVAFVDVLDEVSDRVNELQTEGHNAVGFRVDLTRSKDTNDMVKKVVDQFGKIDILCNVAGRSVPPRPSFVEMTEEYWDMLMDINLKTTFNCCKAVLPLMVEQKYGKVVNIASITGTKVIYRYSAAYAASKAAVAALTRALALEMGEHNINVNVILPGDIDTADRPWKPEDGPRDLGSLTPHLSPPVSRPGKPEEIAQLALFLCTDESSFITGAEMVIDGGVTIVEPFPAPPK